MFRNIFSLALGATLIATNAQPCAFHSYTPQPTIVDQMLASDEVLLARPAGDDPSRFEAVRVLAGDQSVKIPLPVEEATLRRLSSNPALSVLLARDTEDGQWKRLAYVDGAMASVLDGIAPRLSSWGNGADIDRLNFFADLSKHPDELVKLLVLQELDQADYGDFRSLELDPDIQPIMKSLGQMHASHLRPIRILLLGLSESPEVVPFLAKGLRASSRSAGAELGAFATAYIEYTGALAVQELASEYLSFDTMPVNSQLMIVEALAIHNAAGSQDMRSAIQAGILSAVQKNPAIAPVVARQFGARSDWSQFEALAEVLKAKGSIPLTDVIVVSQYVALAAQEQTPESN